MSTTLRDVARKAGVSKSTVSRVLNGSGYVSQETRQRVMETLQALDFQPNTVARSLVQGKTRTIALIVPSINTPFFAELARRAEDVAYRRGYAVMVCNTDEDPEREAVYLRLVQQKQVDGVIVCPARTTSRLLRSLARNRLPIVFVDRTMANVHADTVTTDNAEGAFAAVKHLLSRGHRRIGIVSGPQEIPVMRERLAGWKRALLEEGIEPDAGLIWSGAPTEETGKQAVRHFLALKPPPTAIFTSCCPLTLGVLSALRQQGIRIPQNMALVGFDDFEAASLLDPPLTVVAQPIPTIATVATKLLLERVEGRNDHPAHLVVKTNLVIRKSCAPIQQAQRR